MDSLEHSATTTDASEQPFLDELRRRRAELRESMGALEYALASPASRDNVRWAERVHVALVELSADLREHVVITEGADGLYGELRRRAPRLSQPIARLTHEHGRLREMLDELESRLTAHGETLEVSRIRVLGNQLLGALVRHRQRGSDLVYEAYEVDLGGET